MIKTYAGLSGLSYALIHHGDYIERIKGRPYTTGSTDKALAWQKTS